MTARARWLQLSLALYGVIVLLYATLVGWWVYFFSQEGELFERLFAEAGAPLDAHQTAVLTAETERRFYMFAAETAFLGILLLASVTFVIRSLRREMAAARQQRNFLSAVTHELRSPLASVRLYIDSIRLGRVDGEKQQRYLRHAGQDLDRLGELVDDLLSTRRLTTEGVTVALQDVDLGELAERCVERQGNRHVGTGVAFELAVTRPTLVRADAGALDKVLENLVSNAVKYGGEQPRVHVSVRAEGRFAVLAVRDHGPGLRGVDPQTILQPFVRGQDEDVRDQPGVGLGLYLVDEFVRAHRGKVAVNDGLEGGGTCVTVTLPLAGGARAPDSKVAP